MRSDQREKESGNRGRNDFLQCFGPVGRNRSMAQMVYEALKDAIVNGNLKPGQRLVEQRISDRMHVSRVPVREAIKRLEHRGFVQRLPVRGVIVRKISDEEIREVFGIRAALESYAASLACEHATKEFLAALQKNIEASSRALEDGYLKKAMDLDSEFDEMIYRAAGSKVLHRLITTFLDHIARYRKPLIRSRNDARVFLEGRRAILQAIMRRDRENVERIAKSHILQCRNQVLKD